MKRPSGFTMAIGNPLVALAITAVFAWITYRWWTGDASGTAAIAMLVLVFAAIRASERYEKYRRWKREWEGLGGTSPRRSLPLRFAAAALIWCVMAYGTLVSTGTASGRLAATLFWLGTAIAIIARVVGGLKARRRNAGAKIVSVTSCIGVPGRSPDLARAYAALPDYCRQLLPRA